MEVTTKQKVTLVPKLRFKEFEGEWDNEKMLNHVNSISSGKIKPKENGKYLVYGSTGVIGMADIASHKGDYLLIARVGANAGKINRAKGEYSVTDNTLILDLKETISVDFCEAFLIKFNLNRLIFGSGQPLITGGLLKSINLIFPSLPEQQKIASFLSAVDEKINQLNQKATLLTQYKKGVMQKLFSQELRFKQEDGSDFPEWEEKKLGEIFLDRNEKGHVDMDLLSISIKKGIYYQSESNKKDNSNSDKSKYKRILKGDIGYNSMRMWQGASSVSDLEGIVSPAYTILKRNDENNSNYFGYLFKMDKMIQTFQKHSQGLTSDTWNLKYPMLSKIKVKRPSLKEQEKIANYLTELDTKLAQVNTQIEKAKAFKKGLLQQMFV